MGTGDRGPSEERGDHLLYFFLLVHTHYLEWCYNTFHFSLKLWTSVLEVIDFREMIKSSPSGGLLSEQRPSPGAVQQCIKIFIFHFTEHCWLFSLLLTWFSWMTSENFRLSVICKSRDPSFGTCELTWGCSLCYSSDWGFSRSYLLLRAKAISSNHLEPWTSACTWALYIYFLIHYVVRNSAFTVINKGLLTYIQHTVEGATSVIALECCDIPLGVTVWVSWLYYPVDFLGLYYGYEGPWMLNSWTSDNFQTSLYGHGVLFYHHTTKWQPLLLLIIQLYTQGAFHLFKKGVMKCWQDYLHIVGHYLSASNDLVINFVDKRAHWLGDFRFLP